MENAFKENDPTRTETLCSIPKKAKTAAERQKEYRERVKQRLNGVQSNTLVPEKIPIERSPKKTSAQYQKDYRERIKSRKSVDTIPKGKEGATKKTRAQIQKEYRERKKIARKDALNDSQTKTRKTKAQRQKEYRERLKMKASTKTMPSEPQIEKQSRELLSHGNDFKSVLNIGGYGKLKLMKSLKEETLTSSDELECDLALTKKSVALPNLVLEKNERNVYIAEGTIEASDLNAATALSNGNSTIATDDSIDARITEEIPAPIDESVNNIGHIFQNRQEEKSLHHQHQAEENLLQQKQKKTNNLLQQKQQPEEKENILQQQKEHLLQKQRAREQLLEQVQRQQKQLLEKHQQQEKHLLQEQLPRTPALQQNEHEVELLTKHQLQQRHQLEVHHQEDLKQLLKHQLEKYQLELQHMDLRHELERGHLEQQHQQQTSMEHLLKQELAEHIPINYKIEKK